MDVNMCYKLEEKPYKKGGGTQAKWELQSWRVS